MTRPRKRRPTFSGGSQPLSPDFQRSGGDDSDTSHDGLMSGRLNQRRGSQFGPSSFVERWIHRSAMSQPDGHLPRSLDGHQPLLQEEDDDIGVGIPIDTFPTRNESDSASLKSKPSTRRSSMDSSIDDVCMPLDDEEKDTGASVGLWPDVAVLDEFAAKELKEQANAEAAALVRESVNEAAEAVKDGRLRPRRFVPWDKSNGLRNQSHMRFTYFRDDLHSTVHSPSIAGLLHADQTFSDLFPVPTQAPHMSMTDSFMQGMAQGAAQGAVQGALSAAQSTSGHSATGEAPVPHPPPMPVITPSHTGQGNTAHGAYATRVDSRGDPRGDHAAGSPSSSETPANAARPHSPNPALTNSRADSPAASMDPGPRDAFPDIQPDPATMAKLRPPSVHHTASNAEDEMGPWWLDINSPTEEEMRVISRAFGIHPLTSEDILLHETREKVELFHNYYFVCFTSFDVTAHETGGGSWDSGNNESNTPNSNSEERRRRGSAGQRSLNSSKPSKHHRRRRIERLKPLAVFSIVFKTGIITVHYHPTPHTINVRRRIRLLRDYLNVSSDWISYALIDDITDGYGPLINAVDEDVQGIDDAIMRMHSSHSDSEDDSDDENNNRSVISATTGHTSSTGYREWRQKGNMLRWIGESRKRVMSLLSLLSNKADVIKGFSKRVGDHWSGAPRSEIAMYLSDIQDHLVTMTQSLTHHEKQLARSHSNYLAQINIDMTRTNNEMNDVLSKISVLGTIVLPMNIVTGLWGMNVLVPGQGKDDSLSWFYGILIMMIIFGVSAYFLIMRFV